MPFRGFYALTKAPAARMVGEVMSKELSMENRRARKGSTLFAILALLALICAGVTAYFLYSETAFYTESPSVWSE